MKRYKVMINKEKYSVSASSPGVAVRRAVDDYLKVVLKGKRKPKKLNINVICPGITIKVPVSEVRASRKRKPKKKRVKGEGITVLGDIYEVGTNQSILLA